MKAYPPSTLNPPPFSKPGKKKTTTPPQTQVESGGTTYFISPGQQVAPTSHSVTSTHTLPQQASYTPGYSVYTKPSSHMAQSARAPSYFTPESLRQELLARESVCLSVPVSADPPPSEVEHYHSLCPLETVATLPEQVVRPLLM